ncbi:MAG TPA: biopolymer transporter ExbD [Gemmataceae bacterium]|nr:biopolymer transporter ExbD [Gemmataceae bacterium]
MADKSQRQLDVWIVESNTVYKEVPFAVVTDWVQQNRLVPEDRVKPTGGKDWVTIGSLPTFRPYAPQPEPFRADDTAEALEPVHTGISWKSPHGDEDQDVDMIPLIDVSLVLLVFFMMLRLAVVTTGGGSAIHTPEVEYKSLSGNPETLWIGIHDAKDGPSYALGKGEGGQADLVENLSEKQVLERLDSLLAGAKATDVRIAADKTLPYETIQKLSIELEKRKPAHVRNIMAEVSEKEPS